MKVRQRISLREHGFLLEGGVSSENAVALNKSAFAYLCSLLQEEAQTSDYSTFLKLTTHQRRLALKVQNYVGVLQTPCGTLIEILPKLHTGSEESEEKTRHQLINMLRCLRNSPFKQSDTADIRDARMPLLEVYISQFLGLVNQLVKRGIRSDYIREQKNTPFLKGRLLVAKQVRLNALHPERFYVDCDAYLVNRPANRLIKSTLELVRRASQSANNQRKSRELCFVFEDVPPSSDIRSDFQNVKLSRGMGYYQHVLEWCRLLLSGLGPTASSGSFSTLSLLYPMERVFEDYVAHCLRPRVEEYFGSGALLKTQSSKHALVEDHAGSTIFNLRPDLLVIRNGQTICVMDTKWKLLDASDRSNKYGISQADMYQLYAYGHKYLREHDQKKLLLIYPKTERFQEPLPEFNYEEGFRLKVIPFDLEAGVLVGLAPSVPT